MKEWEIQYAKDFKSITHSGKAVLTEKQKEINLKLRDAVQDLLPIDDDHKLSDCDLLYRFLIARKWDCKSAKKCLQTYVKFRKEERVNSILAERLPPAILPIISVVYGVDKTGGYPVLWISPEHKSVMPIFKSFDKKVLLRAQIQTMERARFLGKTLGVDRCVYVIDFKAITLSTVNSTTLGFLKCMSTLLQELYPEIVSKIIIFNAGWVVTSAWKLMKQLVDSRVQEKVNFFNVSPSVKSLNAFVNPEHILPEFGGNGTTDTMGELLRQEEDRLRKVLPRSPFDERGASTPLAASSRHPDYHHSENSNAFSLNGIIAKKSPTEATSAPIFSNSSLLECENISCNESFLSCRSNTEVNDEKESRKGKEEDSKNHSIQHPRCKPHPSLPFDLNSTLETGTFVGYCGDQCVGIFRRGQVYCQTNWPISILGETDSRCKGNISSEPFQSPKSGTSSFSISNDLPKMLSLRHEPLESGVLAQGWVLGGEILRESRHPIHSHLILCDSTRKALFVLRKGVLRRRLTIYKILGNSSVQTSPTQEHYVKGKHVKVASVIQTPTSKSKNPASWIIVNANVNKNDKTGIDSGSGKFSNWISSKRSSSNLSSKMNGEELENSKSALSSINHVGDHDINSGENGEYGKGVGLSSKVIGFFDKDVAIFQGPLASISLPISFLMMASITLLWNKINVTEKSTKK